MKNLRPDSILSTDTPETFRHAVLVTSEWLKSGGLAAIPTETVYGLAANALDAQAVSGIFRAKGRPSHNPLIVHVDGISMARRLTSHWTPLAQKLADAFWPGPLTLVVDKAPDIPEIVTAGGSTVALRWPGHAFMQAVIRECAFPLAAPSANRSNRLSPTTALHVREAFGEEVPIVVDGGAASVGIESTVVDCTGEQPAILRPGMLHAAEIEAACGIPVHTSTAPAGRSPGQLPIHYAPRAELELTRVDSPTDWKHELEKRNWPVRESRILLYTDIPRDLPSDHVVVIPEDPEAYARALYAELHECDRKGLKHILVEIPPEGPEWVGILDRLHRAAAARG